MSRRRERGLEAGWRDAFAMLRSPALPSIAALGLVLFALFTAWIGAAEALYVRLYGSNAPADAIGFLDDILTTERGWLLVGLGGLVGFSFRSRVAVSQPRLVSADGRSRRGPGSGH